MPVTLSGQVADTFECVISMIILFVLGTNEGCSRLSNKVAAAQEFAIGDAAQREDLYLASQHGKLLFHCLFLCRLGLTFAKLLPGYAALDPD